MPVSDAERQKQKRNRETAAAKATRQGRDRTSRRQQRGGRQADGVSDGVAAGAKSDASTRDEAPLPPAKRVRFGEPNRPKPYLPTRVVEPDPDGPQGMAQHGSGDAPGLVRRLGEAAGLLAPLCPHDLAGPSFEARCESSAPLDRDDVLEANKSYEEWYGAGKEGKERARAYRARIVEAQWADRWPGLAMLMDSARLNPREEWARLEWRSAAAFCWELCKGGRGESLTE